MGAKPRKTEQIEVSVWFNPKTFAEVSVDAKKAGKRPVPIHDQVVKEHGFHGEKVWQQKGIGPFLKSCWKYWVKHESERMLEAAELLRQERDIKERKEKLGVV